MERIPIREAAGRTGLSTDTLRYYEREGLIPRVGRRANGHRHFTSDDLAWVEYVTCLRSVGVGIADIRKYVRLFEGGEATLGERVALLSEHAAAIRATIAALGRNLEEVEEKLLRYRSRLPESPSTV
jgi:DNA-binding transcriptional MerR regulator